jgi:AraC-like DNA-binding protein
VVDTPLLGLILHRDVEACRIPRRYASPAMMFPLGSLWMSLRIGGVSQKLDRSAFALVPANTTHSLDTSTVGSFVVATLLVEPAACAAAVTNYAPHVDPKLLGDVLGCTRVLPRTRWVEELVHRFVFECDVCAKPTSLAAQFLGAELTKEAYFLGREQLAGWTRAPVVFEGDSIATRARTWLEEHLLEPFSITALARHCHVSTSTVLRAFRREHGVPPAVYVRRRRLEEALQLLESARYTVLEIATRVGYDSPSAFASAFRRQFGMSPSSFRSPVPAGTRLPAHGLPPRTAARRESADRRRKR